LPVYSISILSQLGLADFRERTRRTGFFVTMLGVMFFGYLVITGKYTVQFGAFRTMYDSTWAGSMMAVTGSIMLALVGFYLVRGTIVRDRRTEVGQIVAATPIRSSMYLLSKFASNVVVLGLMAAALAVMGFVTLLFRNEAAGLNLWAYVSPFLVITIPVVLFVAAAAVLFDSVRWLQSTAGNVIYFFLAEMCLVLGMLEVPLLDLGAVSFFTDSVRSAASAAFPGEKIGLVMGFVGFDPALQTEGIRIFHWDGIEWNFHAILLRLVWVAASLVVIGIAMPMFDRFDPARSTRRMRRKKVATEVAEPASPVDVSLSEVVYAKLPAATFRYSIINMLAAELRLALKGRHWFWYAVALGLFAAQLVVPFDIARLYLTPALMVWPLALWSAMGTRESTYDTGALLYSSPRPMTHHFPAIWLSGLVVAVSGVGIMMFRAATLGYGSYAASLGLAAFLIPTAALALGTLSGGRRIFEVCYLIVWYIGSVDQLKAMDILGTTDEAITGGKLATLSVLSAAFLITSFLARRMRMARN
jgi:hypothetical protein